MDNLLMALHKGLMTDQTTFYGRTDSGRGVMVTTIPYGKAKLLYIAWNFNLNKEGEFLTYAGFYVPEEKTLFAQWHFLSAMTCKDGRQSFREQAKRELDFTVMWVVDGIDVFNKECRDKLEDELIDDATYVVTDKERKKIAFAYREFLMGIAVGETALSNICKRLGFADHLFDATEAEYLDYCAQRKTLDDLLWSRMDHFKELHTKRCEYKRVSEQLLKDGEVITAQERSFADAVKPIIDRCIKDSLVTGNPDIEIPVVITFKNGLIRKTELLALRYKICDRCPLYYTDSYGYKYSIKDIKRVTVGRSLDDLGPVIWENNF